MAIRTNFSLKTALSVTLIAFLGFSCKPPSGPGEPGNVIHKLKGHERAIHAVSYSPDGSILVSASLDGTVRAWNTNNGSLRATIPAHTGFARDVVFNPNGLSFASAGNDSTIRIWDAGSNAQIREIKTTGPVINLAYHPDGDRIAAATQGTTGGVTSYFIRVFDANDGTLLFSRTTHTALILDMAYSTDGDFFVSSSLDRTIAVAPTTNYIATVTMDFANPIYAVSFTPDGSHVVVGGVDQFVEFFNKDDGELALRLKAHKNTIYTLSYNPSGTMLASGGLDNTAYLWANPNLATVTDPVDHNISSVKSFKGNSVIIRTLAFNNNGSNLATAGSDTDIRIWKVD